MNDKKVSVLMIILMILLSIFLNIIIDKVLEVADMEDEIYKSEIGEPFILDKDTLIVIDYSLMYENFTLSDGTKVHYNLIIK